MMMVLSIALGGALGALGRHFLSGAILRLMGPGFPWGIMTVNIVGSLLMGLLITAFAVKFDSSPELRSFLTVGFLGAFTTFSTFSLEIVMLFQRGAYLQGGLYMSGSVLLAVIGLLCGMWLGKMLI